jgi:hypothetical protein
VLLIGFAFFLPAIASAILLWITWSTELLARPWIHAVWLLVALLVQFGSMAYTPLWAAGIALQVALGVRLAVLWRLDGATLR